MRNISERTKYIIEFWRLDLMYYQAQINAIKGKVKVNKILKVVEKCVNKEIEYADSTIFLDIKQRLETKISFQNLIEKVHPFINKVANKPILIEKQRQNWNLFGIRKTGVTWWGVTKNSSGWKGEVAFKIGHPAWLVISQLSSYTSLPYIFFQIFEFCRNFFSKLS